MAQQGEQAVADEIGRGLEPRAEQQLGEDEQLALAEPVAAVLRLDDIGDNPERWLVIGPDRAANLLEVIVLVTAEGAEVTIHAMPLRAIYQKLLES